MNSKSNPGYLTLQRQKAALILGGGYLFFITWGILGLTIFRFSPLIVVFLFITPMLLALFRPVLRKPFLRKCEVTFTDAGFTWIVQNNREQIETVLDWDDILDFSVNITASFPGNDYLLFCFYLRNGDTFRINIIDPKKNEQATIRPESILGIFLSQIRTYNNRGITEYRVFYHQSALSGKPVVTIAAVIIITLVLADIILITQKYASPKANIAFSFGIISFSLVTLAQMKTQNVLRNKINSYLES